MKEQTHYSKSALKSRDWTDKSIELFLKTPDKEADNPYYKFASPMKLYLISRVEEIEKTNEFIEFKNKNIKKVIGSKKAVETKKQKLLKEVKGWVIKLEKKDYNKVVLSAINSYNTFKRQISFERGNFDFEPATLNSDKFFLERITVNYLRHRLSNYEKKLDRIFGKVGKSRAYVIINLKIYEKIAEVYPELKEECYRQLLGKELIIS